jgi:hypothetical protein
MSTGDFPNPPDRIWTDHAGWIPVSDKPNIVEERAAPTGLRDGLSSPIPRGAMHFAFLLSMPNNNAWNGKWTGDGKCYARVKSFQQRTYKEKLLGLVGNHYYNFGDGWGANVEVKTVTAEEKRKLLKATQGFCGYDWMIDSLLSNGKILA